MPGETYCIKYCSGDEYSLSEQGGVLMHYLRLFTRTHAAADATARPRGPAVRSHALCNELSTNLDKSVSGSSSCAAQACDARPGAHCVGPSELGEMW